MKKIFLSIILALSLLFSILCLPAQAQITKSETVSKNMYAEILAAISFDGDMSETGRLFIFAGQNLEYKHISDAISVFHGNANEMIDFLEKVSAFNEKFKSDGGVSATINGVKVRRVVEMGVGGTYLYKGETNGYFAIRDKSYAKFIKDVKSYCDKNGIKYKK